MAGVGDPALLTPDRLDRPLADPLLRRLFPALPTGVEWELDRSRRALASLGDPQSTFRSVHVGGTNGKGSVTATVASVLRADGHRAGTYTSPHLCSFRERVLVDGRPLAEETLVRYADAVRDAVVAFGLTFFESATLLAFHAFREEGVEAAAVEVGLGGRLDATNVVRPEVAAVTNIAMDHAEFLGDTLAQIAAEKAGIMKPGVPFVTAETDAALLALFRERGHALGAPVHALGAEGVRDVVVARDHTAFGVATRSWGALEVVTPLVGRHQAVNTALAIEIFEHLPESLRPDARTLLDGIRAVRHRGRDDVRVIGGRTWLFDVAHNPAGAASLVDTLDCLDLPRPHVVLFGALGDKDWRSMLPPLLERVERAVLTVPATAPPERRWDPVAAAEELRGHGHPSGGRAGMSARPHADVHAVVDFAAAAREAAELAGAGTVVVTGSVHTVGNAMGLLGIDPLA
ncbi:MAG TPA: Mur ligase family protein [Longimicrobiales bacterium]|nr:Mur ligase family protein [Longimicrobiales bacterium]